MECTYLHVYCLFCLISFPGTDKISDITEKEREEGVIKSGTTEERNFNNTTLSSSRACLEEASLLAQNGRGPIYYSGGTQRTPNGARCGPSTQITRAADDISPKIATAASFHARSPHPSLPRPFHAILQRRDIAHFIKHYDNVCMKRRV